MTNTEKLSREEIAKREIGHTDSTRPLNLFITVTFLVVIAAVPLMQNFADVAALRAGREPGRALPQCWDPAFFLMPTAAEVRAVLAGGPHWVDAVLAANARIMRDRAAYEKQLEDRDPIVNRVVPWMQLLITGWLQGGNEDAYCGRDGWLFYRRDIDSLTGAGFLDSTAMARRAASGNEIAAAPQPDPIRAIVDFRDSLAARKIGLVLVPVPVKPTVHAERFSERYAADAGPVHNPSFHSFLRQLKDAKIAVFDPTATLLRVKAGAAGNAVSLATDTHWTPAAMRACADELATFIRTVADLPAPSINLRVDELALEGRGDVAGMLDFPPGITAYPLETVTVQRVTNADGLAWRPDANAEILLLGDSFTNIYSLGQMGWGDSAGLGEHLALALGLPIDVIARNDAGSHVTREMLAQELARGRDRLAGKKVVVWQFAARELSSGDWKIVPLPPGRSAAVEMYLPPPSATVEVRGRVQAVSEAPRPGTVPYKDHIFAIHVVDLESAADPAATGREAVVLRWSMKDNKSTAAASYRPGDVVTLRLQRWEDVAETYDAINRSDLDDDAMALVEPAWAE